MSLWLLTAGLLVVTVVAFVWAKASSGGGRAEAGENVILDAPQQQPMRKQAKGEAQVQEPGYARAPAPASRPAHAAVRSSSPNTLAWATFAVSAFGTLSSFVFSLLTYLRSS